MVKQETKELFSHDSKNNLWKLLNGNHLIKKSRLALSSSPKSILQRFHCNSLLFNENGL